MKLGAFSVSLNVKDLAASQQFYEQLGFVTMGGDASENWLIMKNGDHVLGLFQGMFEKNMLTFNPGWDQNGANVDPFVDIREIQAKLKAAGIEPVSEVGSDTTGPGNMVLEDPDGNPILIDQHR